MFCNVTYFSTKIVECFISPNEADFVAKMQKVSTFTLSKGESVVIGLSSLSLYAHNLLGLGFIVISHAVLPIAQFLKVDKDQVFVIFFFFFSKKNTHTTGRRGQDFAVLGVACCHCYLQKIIQNKPYNKWQAFPIIFHTYSGLYYTKVTPVTASWC